MISRGRRRDDNPWRQPFSLLVAFAGALSGGGSLALGQTPGSLDALLPHEFDVTWAILLLFGSVVDLVGLFWRGRISMGLSLRCVGLLGMGGALLVYGPVIGYVGRHLPGAFIPAIILTAYGASCWAQAWLLLREEQRIERVAAHLTDVINQGGPR